ncbi:twitching motility protein PilT [Moorena producens PAL-8-15-08-1]|uniref:Twitching motility protein PilT n=1 Tax=Moorena producens PAL-8-15-08-1 TaxID=1458985 RepID=A0A1D8TV74_9CYAN|nr:type II toxin-antitoxin system VapC family toxin [Moorena producens]AOX01560.1 twitching motility protein PilT [Moorena producens PAL-8-15-08-1]
MSYLVDTNVLLRLVQKTSPMHPDARKAIFILRRQGVSLCIIPQNLIEFWAVATRPISNNGLGLSIDEASQATDKIKRLFVLYPDTPGILAEWESIIIKHQVKGKQVHDARLVAAMVTHKITHLLTFNIDDFKRFSEIISVNPQSVASQA